MAITEIQYGSVASSKELNDNFEALNEDIQSLAATVSTVNANLVSSISSINTNLSSQIESVNTSISEVFEIGAPQVSLTGVLPNNCIWLEGAEVSRTTYSDLFDIYGTTYGEGDGSTTFALPDFRERVLWGSSDESFGYVDAGLPNITGTFGTTDVSTYWDITPTEAFTRGSQINSHLIGNGGTRAYWYTMSFKASNANSIYSSDVDTVQPPAVKVRFFTRYQ